MSMVGEMFEEMIDRCKAEILKKIQEYADAQRKEFDRPAAEYIELLKEEVEKIFKKHNM